MQPASAAPAPRSGPLVVPGRDASTVPPRSAARANERVLLAYSPVWMAAIAALMLTRRMAAWGDVEHLVFGVALALPPWIWPLTRAAARADGDRPLAARHATHFAAAVAITTLIQSYFGAELFFDRLGMEYHFHTRWLLAGTPLFLYFVTIAYFSTYYVVLVAADRALGRGLARLMPRTPRPVRLLARFALCYAVAFGETWFMASDLIADFFSYRDRSFALLVGSVGYGALFFCTLPLFVRLDAAPPDARPPLRLTLRDVLAANMLSLVVYEVFAHAIGKPW